METQDSKAPLDPQETPVREELPEKEDPQASKDCPVQLVTLENLANPVNKDPQDLQGTEEQQDHP